MYLVEIIRTKMGRKGDERWESQDHSPKGQGVDSQTIVVLE